jgi:hypothetical protein
MKKMKKIIVAVLIMVFCTVGICVIGPLCNDTTTNSIYPLTVQVAELDHEADVVVCVDSAGNGWEFYGVEDWQVGDFVSLLMDDNGTPETIYDDVITMTRYAGIFEG